MNDNKWKERAGEIAGWLGVFFLIMIGVGILLDSKMRDLVNVYLEKQVTLQTEILAENIEEKLNSEIRVLENVAKYLGEEKARSENLLQVLEWGEPGISVGIINIRGETICGENLSMEDFPGIHESVHGHSSVSYNEEKGLLFTVPVYHEDNIKYVLYKLFEKDTVIKRFAVTSYGKEGKIAICDRTGQLVVPIPDWTEEEHMLFESDTITKGLETVAKKMKVSSAAAELVEYKEKDWFLFVAEIGQTDFQLVGAISRDYLSDGINYIVTLVVWVFGLLLVLVLLGIIYLLIVEGKARESDELRHAKQTAEQENRAKSDFLAKMSHEIRTPINAVMGMNEMILRESGEEEIKGYAQNIRRASKNLLSIINDILDFSKIESGKMEMIENPYSMGMVLYDVLNIVRVRAEQKNLELHTEIEESLPDALYGDEVKVRQIITNILGNAVKYTKSGSVFLRVSGTQEEETAIYCISVKDTGIGIHQEDMEKLFEDFERLDREENKGIEGTGLGLAITNRLLMLMGGRMEVTSDYGKGSTFTVYLPQKIVGEGQIGNVERRFAEQTDTSGYCESFIAPGAKVLVVDDTDVNLQVVKGLLKNTKVEVTTCISGAECLALVQQYFYDIILLDHMMPDMDGIETLKQLRELENNLCENTPVIALTANAIVGVRDMYLEAGFDDYLSKPIEGDTLEQVVQKYLPPSKVIQTHKKVIIESNLEQKKKVGRKTMIDREVGLEYCGGLEEIYMEVLETYCEEGPEYLQKLAEYQKQKDWKNYSIVAHTIKSNAKTIGAMELSEAAKEQEMAAKAGDEETINAKWELVYKAYQDVLEEVKNML